MCESPVEEDATVANPNLEYIPVQGQDLGDPAPPPEGADRELVKAYEEDVRNYSTEMWECLMANKALREEELWIDFTCTFRKASIKAMSSTQQVKWVDFLRSRGVKVRKQRGLSRANALTECLTADTFPRLEPEISCTPVRNVDRRDVTEVHENDPDEQSRKGSAMRDLRQRRQSYSTKEFGSEKAHDIAGIITGNEDDRGAEEQYRFRRMGVLDSKPSTHSPTASKVIQDQKRHDGTAIRLHSSGRGSGAIMSLMKAYGGRKLYGGQWEEDLDGSLEVFETLAATCCLTDDEKARAIPVMLRDDALSYYSTTFRNSEASYGEIVNSLRKWFTSEEQRNRLLRIWQKASLSEAMRRQPMKSEVEVFRELSHRLSRIQNQLDVQYHRDSFLRDQLVMAADIPHLERSLRERVPKTAHEAMHRIAASLSNEPRSAGANWTAVDSHNDDTQAHYGLGKSFGGQARKQLGGTVRRGYHKNRRRLANVKGCWVCGGDHMAREKHAPKEIVAAIDKLKNNSSNKTYTVDDLAEVANALWTAGDTDEEQDFISDEDDEANILEFQDEMRDEYSLNKSLEEDMANASFLHGRSFIADLERDMAFMHAQLSLGEQDTFRGLILDTGANRSSCMSLSQYKAYCRENNVPLSIDRTEGRTVSGFGGSKRGSLGSAIIPVPFVDLNVVLHVKFQIFSHNSPSLLCLRDMREGGLDISVQKLSISYKHRSQSVSLENDFMVHNWKSEDVVNSLYSEKELRKLHRNFGHPSVSALTNLLKRANPDHMDREVQDAIMRLTKACTTCATHASRPRRFKLTVGTNDLKFNHTLAVDIMTLNGKPLLHVVDEATHYTSAVFLNRQRASDTWKGLLRCWSRVYLGPPDFLRMDQGTNFIAKEFVESATAEGITVLPAPIESPSTMSHVERYHAPLRAAFKKIRDSLPTSESDSDCLQMALKAVNDTIGPEGLCPTLLVYGALPRHPLSAPNTTQLERAKSMDDAMDSVRKVQAQRRVAFGLRHPGGPKAKENSEELSRLPAGSPVYVYRKTTEKWDGPFPFIHIDGETVVVQLPRGRKIFRSNVVKPQNSPSFPKENLQGSTTQSPVELSNEPGAIEEDENFLCSDISLQAMFGPGSYLYCTPDEPRDFSKSRMTELQGLEERQTFEVVKLSSVPKGTRIYGSRWVDTLKTLEDGSIAEKSRLVAQNYKDKGASSIATKSPTISRMGQRVAMATAAIFREHQSYIRDISQAYLQSESPLERKIFLRPPKEMNLGADVVLCVLKPLYGVPESGLHWFVTYWTHHRERLSMKSTTGDPCLLYRPGDMHAEGVTALQVDDSFGHGTVEFLKDEERESKRFKCKPRKILKIGETTSFNGCQITVERNRVHLLRQMDKLGKISKPRNQDELVSVRALLQYIGCCTRPDLCAPVQLLASEVNNPEASTYSKMESIVERCHNTKDMGLTFIPLERSSLRLALFTDASFANADRYKSQIGCVVLLVDSNNNANIIHYGSSRCKRVTRSVMAAELHALVYGFDQAFVVRAVLEELLGQSIQIDGYIDSRTVFNVVAKSSATLEKRLQIDAHALRESHEKGELRYLAWIPGKENIADGLTKELANENHALLQVMRTNKLHLNPNGWVDNAKGKPTEIQCATTKQKTSEC